MRSSRTESSREDMALNEKKGRNKGKKITRQETKYGVVFQKSKECQICGIKFGFRTRTHHCRFCGRAVCAACRYLNASSQISTLRLLWYLAQTLSQNSQAQCTRSIVLFSPHREQSAGSSNLKRMCIGPNRMAIVLIA